MNRLTTDNPQGNFETMMNYAYAKDGNVTLRYGAGKDDIDLCEYMETVAKCQYSGLTANDYMEGACLECDRDCPFGILYAVSTQAAELRARLMEYENREEQCDISELIEDVLDTLVEVGNGVTNEMLHEAADKLFKVRELLTTLGVIRKGIQINREE